MKLTDNILDQLIAEQMRLNEDLSPEALDTVLKALQGKSFEPIKKRTQDGWIGSGEPGRQAAFDLLKKMDDPDDELTPEDFEYMLRNVDDLTTDHQSRLVAIKKSPSASDNLKAHAIAVLNAIDAVSIEKSKERQSITQPAIRTAAAAYGKFNDEATTLIKNLFPSGGNIVTRIKKLSDISTLFFQAAAGDNRALETLSAKDNRVFLNEIMIMDYFAEISKSMDSGSGGYVFEYFLALLTGGNVAGKETGPAGGMGAVDFRTANNTAGSAKWYKKASGIHQATGGFNDGESVDYIVGLKKQGGEQELKPSRGTAEPEKITSVDIYYFRVVRKGDKFHMYRLTQQGEMTSGYRLLKPNAEGKLVFDRYLDNKTYLATIKVAKVRTQSFRDMLDQAVSSEVTSIKRTVLNLFKGFFDSLDEAAINSKKYVSSGDLEDGTSTLAALDSADDNFKQLATQLGDTVWNRQLVKENNQKITEEILDKLIEEVILTK